MARQDPRFQAIDQALQALPHPRCDRHLPVKGRLPRRLRARVLRGLHRPMLDPLGDPERLRQPRLGTHIIRRCRADFLNSIRPLQSVDESHPLSQIEKPHDLRAQSLLHACEHEASTYTSYKHHRCTLSVLVTCSLRRVSERGIERQQGMEFFFWSRSLSAHRP